MDSNSTIRLIKLELDQIIEISRVAFFIGFQLGLIFRAFKWNIVILFYEMDGIRHGSNRCGCLTRNMGNESDNW